MKSNSPSDKKHSNAVIFSRSLGILTLPLGVRSKTSPRDAWIQIPRSVTNVFEPDVAANRTALYAFLCDYPSNQAVPTCLQLQREPT